MTEYNRLWRYVLMALCLFPALWGILAFLNNTSGFDSTVEYAVKPLILWQIPIILLKLGVYSIRLGCHGRLGLYYSH